MASCPRSPGGRRAEHCAPMGSEESSVLSDPSQSQHFRSDSEVSVAVTEGPHTRLDIAPLVSAFEPKEESLESQMWVGCSVLEEGRLGPIVPNLTTLESWQNRHEQDLDDLDWWDECFGGNGPESQETRSFATRRCPKGLRHRLRP